MLCRFNQKHKPVNERRKESRFILLYKGLKGKVAIPANDVCSQSKKRRTHHYIAFQELYAMTDTFQSNLNPCTFKDSNVLLRLFPLLVFFEDFIHKSPP